MFDFLRYTIFIQFDCKRFNVIIRMKTNRVVKFKIRKKGYGTLFCQFCFYIDINIAPFSVRGEKRCVSKFGRSENI